MTEKTTEAVSEYTPFRGREAIPGQHVRVYYNLHKGCFTLLDPQSRLVIGHAPHVTLRNARFLVYGSGQARVRETGQKNVHAFVDGVFESCDTPKVHRMRAGTYNPRTMDFFQDTENNKPLTGLYPVVVCTGKGIRYRVAKV
jgi:hypothetical protein